MYNGMINPECNNSSYCTFLHLKWDHRIMEVLNSSFANKLKTFYRSYQISITISLFEIYFNSTVEI